MGYLVKIMPRAERDLEAIFATIHAGESDAAFRWFLGLERAVLTLEVAPARCPVAPEDLKVRQLLYGNKPHVYRVIFRIAEAQRRVDELHIRHGARKAFKKGDLR